MAEIPKQNLEKNDNKRLHDNINKEKTIEENYDPLKFKMEQALFTGGINDRQFLNNYLRKYNNLNLDYYSKDQQKRIIDEIKIVIDELGRFNPKMINDLRKIRESMSCGLEKGKSDNYYKSMILGNKINGRILIIKESIDTIYGERIKIGNKEYNKKDYEEFKSKTQELDQKNNLNLFGKIHLDVFNNSFGYNFSFKQLFASEIKTKIDKSNPKYSLIMLDLNRLGQLDGERGFENLQSIKLINGQIINISELYKEYFSGYNNFKTKNRVFELGNQQLKTASKGFGFDNKKYNLGYEELEKAYAEKISNIDKMGLADLVIMIRIFGSIIPGVGDVLGGYDDSRQALAGINFDGSIHGTGENIGMYLIGGLQLSVIGGRFATLAKGPKLAKVIVKLTKVLEKLSKTGKLQDLAKNEQIMKLLEHLQKISPKAKELLNKIKNITRINPLKKEKIPLLTEVPDIKLKVPDFKDFKFGVDGEKILKQKEIFSFGTRQKAIFEQNGIEISGILVQLKDGRIGLFQAEHEGRIVVNICQENKGKLIVQEQKMISENDITKGLNEIKLEIKANILIEKIKKVYQEGFLEAKQKGELDKFYSLIDGMRFVDIENYSSYGGVKSTTLNKLYDIGDDAFIRFQEAADYLRESLKRKVPLSRELFEKINYLCLRGGVEGSDESKIGRYRMTNRENVGFRNGESFSEAEQDIIKSTLFDSTYGKTWGPHGSFFDFPPSTEVSDKMEELLSWYNINLGKMDPIELAAIFQKKFVTIHPFINGNGRTSRLIMDYILELHDLPPASGLLTTNEMFLKNEDWTKVVKKAIENTAFRSRFYNTEVYYTDQTNTGKALRSLGIE